MAITTFNFMVNGNAVQLDFERTGLSSANVSYDIRYADGDYTYDSTNGANDVATVLIELFSNLAFNADIKTRKQVDKYIGEVYSEEDTLWRESLADDMARRMNIID